METINLTWQNDQATIDVNDLSLYGYALDQLQVGPLQQAAAVAVMGRLKQRLLQQLLLPLEGEPEVAYVATFSEEAEAKLESGEWELAMREDSNETYAVLRDVATGQIQSWVTLEQRSLQHLGQLPAIAAMQRHLSELAAQMESLHHLDNRVEQGQFMDRYAGFYSARQLVIEALAAHSGKLRRSLLQKALARNNDAIAQLMLMIHQEATRYLHQLQPVDHSQQADWLLQTALDYLNAAVQLNLTIYTVLEEHQAMLAAVNNYQAFLNQTLLRKHPATGLSVAEQIDQQRRKNDSRF